MFEEKAKNYAKEWGTPTDDSYACCRQGFIDGAEYGYKLAHEEMDYLNQHWKSEDERKANEWHSPNEHIDKDMVVLGIIKLCNKPRYSLVQWNGEWWYQYGTYNAEVRLIVWYNIPELPKEIK